MTEEKCTNSLEIFNCEDDGQVDIDNRSHIESVTIYGGNDDYGLREKVIIRSTDEGELLLSAIQKISLISKKRIRGEVAVEFAVKQEGDEHVQYFYIAHHKGTICLCQGALPEGKK